MNTSPWDTPAILCEIAGDIPTLEELRTALKLARLEAERKIEHGRPKGCKRVLYNVILD